MKLPTSDTLKALHKKYAPSERAFELIFTHSVIVKEIAEDIVKKKNLKVNSDLLAVGALIHDIGTYKLINTEGKFDTNEYIMHGILGYEILKDEGYSEVICRFTTNHTGVGITKEEIIKNNLPLPPKDYLAESLEEKLIMYSDKFHSKVPQFNSVASLLEYIKVYGEEKIKKVNELITKFGIPDIEIYAKKYNHPII
jgi:uncharacterized protein